MVDVPIGLRPVATGERSIVETGIWAESAGYDTVWVSEGWGYDAFVKLTEIAIGTDGIGLGTSIVNVYSRSPAVLAMAGASLAEAGDGRFVLGLGVSHPELVEGLHGMAYDRPLRRLRETVDLIRAFAGDDDRVEYDGEVFDVGGYPGIDAEIPVYNAALGPANRRLTGRLCDGWLPYNVPLSDLEAAFETVADAAREAGRDPDEVEVAPWVPAAVADDPDEAYDAMRRNVAWYVGSFDAYRNAVATRFPAAEEIATEWRAGDEGAAEAAVTDAMVDALGIAGTPDGARDRLRELCAEPTIDAPIVATPRGADDALVARTFEALAPSNL